MLIDTQQVSAGQVVRADLCLIVAGAAGITIARRLSATGLEICLLEAGGLDLDLEVQDLYAGPAEGTVLPTDSAYLTRSRLRYFGGSTNHWTGYCRPLDDIDFTVRPWVPNSGWPFPKSALEAYYEEAAGIVRRDVRPRGRTDTFSERDRAHAQPERLPAERHQRSTNVSRDCGTGVRAGCARQASRRWRVAPLELLVQRR